MFAEGLPFISFFFFSPFRGARSTGVVSLCLLVLPGRGGGDWLVLREGSCYQGDPPRSISVHCNLCPWAWEVQNQRKICLYQ